VELHRKDVVNWLVQRKDDELSAAEEADLAEAHYNEVRFLHAALREMKAAQSRGENISLEDFLNRTASSKPKVARRKKTVIVADTLLEQSGHSTNDIQKSAKPRTSQPSEAGV
jgi:hypothetical protein